MLLLQACVLHESWQYAPFWFVLYGHECSAIRQIIGESSLQFRKTCPCIIAHVLAMRKEQGVNVIEGFVQILQPCTPEH